ncbi:MAG: FHA domain-containing protein, partial [Alistipes sp.]|nr:FHA domain-containing protein [Alistipes sp.]
VVNGILLRVMQGEEYGKTIRLKELLKLPRRLLTVGRNDPFTPNDVVIRENLSSYISRRHSTLQYDDVNMKWYIRDGQWINNTGSGHWQSSLNGTYVNSTQVSDQGMEIRPGDIISMGDVKLRVEGY